MPDPTPVSWLDLERMALAELPAAQLPQVADAAQNDPATAAIAERISSDRRRLRPLPPVDHHAPAGRAQPRRRWQWALAMFATSAAVAAALLLFVRATGDQVSDRATDPATGPAIDRPTTLEFANAHTTIKGGDLAIALVRERAGHIVHEPNDFRPDDRFKVLITCPTDTPRHGQVRVYQGKGDGIPIDGLIDEQQPLPCGNRLALPGAFRLTGVQDAHICLRVTVGDVHQSVCARLRRSQDPTGP